MEWNGMGWVGMGWNGDGMGWFKGTTIWYIKNRMRIKMMRELSE